MLNKVALQEVRRLLFISLNNGVKATIPLILKMEKLIRENETELKGIEDKPYKGRKSLLKIEQPKLSILLAEYEEDFNKTYFISYTYKGKSFVWVLRAVKENSYKSVA